MAVRTRRRQMFNAVGAGLIAAVVILGATSGITTLSAEGPKPAEFPTVTPTPTLPTDLGAPIVGPFEAPPQAPIVVGTHRTNGWTWMLSSSADGRCIAFTDAQGTEVDCSGPSGDPIDAYVDGGHSPAGVTFVFGRLPREANVVRLSVPSRHSTTGKVFIITPRGLNLEYLLFVGSIEGYAYPWVPDAIVQAVDTGEGVIASRPLELPTWARAPFTVLATVASGTLDLPLWDDPPKAWEIDIFRDERTGEICLGEPGGESACGDADDPVPGWIATWSSFTRVTSVVDTTGFGQVFGVSPRFEWGVFRDPVSSVDVQVLEEKGKPSTWHSFDPEIFRLPAGYEDAYSIYVIACDCWGIRIQPVG